MIAKKTQLKIIDCRKDAEGRLILLEIEYEGDRLLLVNIYTPNIDQPQYFANIDFYLAQFDHENIIIGGDFNCVLDTEKDKVGGKQNMHTKSREVIKRLQNKYDLIDIWRKEHPNMSQFTWKHYKPETIMVRLDYYLVSVLLKENINANEIMTSFMTNHDMSAFMYTKNKKRGPGFLQI